MTPDRIFRMAGLLVILRLNSRPRGIMAEDQFGRVGSMKNSEEMTQLHIQGAIHLLFRYLCALPALPTSRRGILDHDFAVLCHFSIFHLNSLIHIDFR